MTELKDEERRAIVDIVNENRDGKYWKVILRQLKKMLETQEKNLNMFKQIKMSPEKINEYNLILEKIELIKRFMNVNDEIINEHMTFFERLKHTTALDRLIEPLMTRFKHFSK